MTDKNTIKNWFRNNLKPTQEQFWAWVDSFWHKSEKIPQTQIEGLGDSLANKADVSQLNAKANTDASGLSAENIISWKEALGVRELPSNIATVDSGFGEGNVHTKEQIAALLENIGKNMANSQLVTTAEGGVTQRYNYTWDTAGYYLYFKGLPEKSNDTTFNKLVVRDSNGQLAESNGINLLFNAVQAMNDTQRQQYIYKLGSTGNGLVYLDTALSINIKRGATNTFVIRGRQINNLHPQAGLIKLICKSDQTTYTASYNILDTNAIEVSVFIPSNATLGEYTVSSFYINNSLGANKVYVVDTSSAVKANIESVEVYDKTGRIVDDTVISNNTVTSTVIHNYTEDTSSYQKYDDAGNTLLIKSIFIPQNIKSICNGVIDIFTEFNSSAGWKRPVIEIFFYKEGEVKRYDKKSTFFQIYDGPYAFRGKGNFYVNKVKALFAPKNKEVDAISGGSWEKPLPMNAKFKLEVDRNSSKCKFILNTIDNDVIISSIIDEMVFEENANYGVGVNIYAHNSTNVTSTTTVKISCNINNY
ncbi:hypothetical protein PG279_01140 [Riemerella anatipestifer]|nr:hypothetical protein [Riemerella anatipestifer]